MIFANTLCCHCTPHIVAQFTRSSHKILALFAAFHPFASCISPIPKILVLVFCK